MVWMCSCFIARFSGSATAAITTRVSSLLSSKAKCTKDDISELYDLRSRIMHGNIKASDEPGDELKKLNHLDFLTVECFKAIADRKLYKEYSDKSSRDRLMGTLNTNT